MCDHFFINYLFDLVCVFFINEHGTLIISESYAKHGPTRTTGRLEQRMTGSRTARPPAKLPLQLSLPRGGVALVPPRSLRHRLRFETWVRD